MKRFLPLLGLAGLLVASCRKDDPIACAPTVVPPVLPGPPSLVEPLVEFTRRNGDRPQYFRIALGQAQTITTKGNATLTFPANYFNLPDGTLARDSALAQVRELYTVPDMVLANMPTRMAGTRNLLLSGGEFQIKVKQGAVRLTGSSISASQLALRSPIPSGQDTTQQLWQQPVTQGALLGWQTSAAYPAVQTRPPFYRAIIPLDSVGWWNIDRIWQAYTTASLTAVLVATPASPTNDTRVYVRPVGANGLVQLFFTGSISTQSQWQATLPVGEAMQVIVLQAVAGQLYFGTQQFTVQTGLNLAPTLTAVSEAEAVRFIRQL